MVPGRSQAFDTNEDYVHDTMDYRMLEEVDRSSKTDLADHVIQEISSTALHKHHTDVLYDRLRAGSISESDDDVFCTEEHKNTDEVNAGNADNINDAIVRYNVNDAPNDDDDVKNGYDNGNNKSNNDNDVNDHGDDDDIQNDNANVEMSVEDIIDPMLDKLICEKILLLHRF
jgi:hypothetical protein